jgi:beta-lactamase regulating signal transducer with metallopeptidase domain
METLLLLTLSGSALALLLLALRYLFLKRMPSTVYYYAWLLVLLRFVLPLPGFVPVERAAQEASPSVRYA